MAYRNQPARTYRRGEARTVTDQVDHMLRSLGERVVMAAQEAGQGAGRLGNRLLDMDDAYAAAVSKAAPNAPMQAMSGTSLRQLGSNYRENGIYSNTGNLQEDLLRIQRTRRCSQDSTLQSTGRTLEITPTMVKSYNSSYTMNLESGKNQIISSTTGVSLKLP